MSPPGWHEEQNTLVKVFKFNNFVEAIEFVNKIVPLAEEKNHHPDIEIFAYKNVKVKLTTHDAGKVTQKDTELAEEINRLH